MGPHWGHLPLDPPDWTKSWATSGVGLLLDVQVAMNIFLRFPFGQVEVWSDPITAELNLPGHVPGVNSQRLCGSEGNQFSIYHSRDISTLRFCSERRED